MKKKTFMGKRLLVTRIGFWLGSTQTRASVTRQSAFFL
jgi:hypothetical protein